MKRKHTKSLSNQIEIFNEYNQSLFSNNYLQYKLPESSLWKINEEVIQLIESSVTY
ncbi:MAG: hypothetical protein KAI43_10350 [Candidatus Aureabacteria bacterium]|nr:hypothetical protein [Candidatus Auribacterota bacterium]